MLQDEDELSVGSADFYRRPQPPHVDFVAWHDQDIVGVISGTFAFDYRDNGSFDSFDLPTGPHAFLTRLYVRQPARRRRVGFDLVRAFAEEAEARRCTYVVGSLDLSSDPRARTAFFVAVGFDIADGDMFGATPRDILDSIT